MSVATFPDGNYRMFGTALADTSQTTVYTVPTGFTTAYIVYFNASDDGAAARTLPIEWTDSSASVTYVLTFQEEIPANQAMEIKPLWALDVGDTLKCTGSAAGINIVISVMEISGRKA